MGREFGYVSFKVMTMYISNHGKIKLTFGCYKTTTQHYYVALTTFYISFMNLSGSKLKLDKLFSPFSSAEG